MKEYIVKIYITEGKNTLSTNFNVKAEDFDDAVNKVKNNLDSKLWMLRYDDKTGFDWRQ